MTKRFRRKRGRAGERQKRTSIPSIVNANDFLVSSTNASASSASSGKMTPTDASPSRPISMALSESPTAVAQRIETE
jgi:hypothetical protein